MELGKRYDCMFDVIASDAAFLTKDIKTMAINKVPVFKPEGMSWKIIDAVVYSKTQDSVFQNSPTTTTVIYNHKIRATFELVADK